MQGVHVPVHCGIVGLRVLELYDNVELTHVLFMSWAGRSVQGHTKSGVAELTLSRRSRQDLDSHSLQTVLDREIQQGSEQCRPRSLTGAVKVHC